MFSKSKKPSFGNEEVNPVIQGNPEVYDRTSHGHLVFGASKGCFSKILTCIL